jgi:hypothetical protein
MTKPERELRLLAAGISQSRLAAVVIMVALSSLPVILIGTVAYFSAYRALTHQIVDDNFEQTRGVREALSHYVEERLNDMAFLAEGLPNHDVTVTGSTLLLDRFRANYRMLSYIALWDSKGRLIAQSGRSTGLTATLPKALESKIAGASWSGVVGPSGRIGIDLAVPIWDADKSLEGWLSAELPGAELGKLLRSWTAATISTRSATVPAAPFSRPNRRLWESHSRCYSRSCRL